jgi:hypothetical protein
MKSSTIGAPFFILLSAIFIIGMIFWPESHVLALSAAVHVPEKYTDVLAGERFYFEIEIKYPENISRKDLKLQYDITKNGEIISQSKFLKAVETQASFMDYVVIPASIEKGLYEIRVKISDYQSLNEETSASFYVKSANNSLFYYFLVLLGAIIIFGIFVAIEIKKLSKN